MARSPRTPTPVSKTPPPLTTTLPAGHQVERDYPCLSQKYSNINQLTERAITMCTNTNEDTDEIEVCKNMFFNILCNDEYMKGCLNINVEHHYKKLLKQSGFIISNIGNRCELLDDKKKEQITRVNDTDNR